MNLHNRTCTACISIILTLTVQTCFTHHRFTPEATIINYYHMDSTLSGHTDQSELDHTAPLVSVRYSDAHANNATVNMSLLKVASPLNRRHSPFRHVGVYTVAFSHVHSVSARHTVVSGFLVSFPHCTVV